MSNQDHNEYMNNVRWKTAIYIVVSAASILLALAGIYYGLKGDIKDGRTETKELFLATNHKIDSIQHDNNINFQEIWDEIHNIKPQVVIKRAAPRNGSYAAATEKWVNGKLIVTPLK